MRRDAGRQSAAIRAAPFRARPFVGTLLVALIYICVSLVPMLLIPQAELAASNAPFADLFARYPRRRLRKLLAAFVIVERPRLPEWLDADTG